MATIPSAEAAWAKHHLSDHIPNRINPIDIRLHSGVDMNEPSIHLNPDLVEIEPFRTRASSNRHEDLLSRNLFLLSFSVDCYLNPLLAGEASMTLAWVKM